MPALWTIAANPRRRRTKGRKHRTAAQRAATRRMLAANRSRRVRANPRKRTRARRRTSVAVAAPRRTRRIRRSAHRVARRSARRGGRSLSMRGITGGAMALLKAGAVGAGGALAADVAMGFVNGFLPATMNSKLDAAGGPNYMNYAAKFGVVLGVRALASKVLSAETANRMAAGAVTIMAYEILRPMASSMLPASMTLGWFSPGMTYRVSSGQGPGMGRYENVAGMLPRHAMGRYENVSTLRSPNAVPANSRRG